MTDPNDLLPPDTAVPHAARIYDYTLGGTFNVAADREVAEAMYRFAPSTRKWVRMLRDFLQTVARELYAEGFRQFLDLGSGLPTQDHVHHVVPGATVIYCDKDVTAVQYGQHLLQGLPTVHYLQGDLRDVGKVLGSETVKQHIDRTQKVAIGLNGVLVFLNRLEVEDLAQTLYDWAPAGSKIYLTYETKELGRSSPEWEKLVGMFAAAGEPFHIISLEENIEMMAPWRTRRIEALAEYLNLPLSHITDADREGVGLEFYASLLTK